MLIHWFNYFGIYNMHIDNILKIFLSNGVLISCIVSIDRMRDINLEVLLFIQGE